MIDMAKINSAGIYTASELADTVEISVYKAKQILKSIEPLTLYGVKQFAGSDILNHLTMQANDNFKIPDAKLSLEDENILKLHKQAVASIQKDI